MSKEQITKEMTIEEIFTRFPQKSQILAQEMSNSGLHCSSCSSASFETLEGGMLGHGKTEKQIDQLVKKLNSILEEEFDPATISLTERAAEKFKEILNEEGKSGWGLKFSDRPAGCNGFEYVLDFSEKAAPKDKVFESQGIEIHVPSANLGRLLGSVIDYVDGLQGAGFKISNPHAKSSCGCGTSHGY